MTGPDPAAAAELRSLLIDRFPAWAGHLRASRPGSDVDQSLLSLPVPAHRGHSLELAVESTEVTVSWHDGRPPGPAERLFVFPESERADAHRVIVSFISDLVKGDWLLVRERLGPITRLLRGRDCDSIASFVHADDLGRIPARRIATVDSWPAQSTTVTPFQLRYPVLYLSPRLDVGVIRTPERFGRCAAVLMHREGFYDDLRVVDSDARLYEVTGSRIVWPRSSWARALVSILDLHYHVSVRLDLHGPAELEEIRARVHEAVENDPEILAEMTGHDPDWWRERLDQATTAAELIDSLAGGGIGA